MRLQIDRHVAVYSGNSPPYLGELIESFDWAAEAVPRVGEFVTCHPDIEPSENTFGGVVCRVHHTLDRGQLIVVAIADAQVSKREDQ